MNKHYKTGVVSGKFRLLHTGHKEVILRATLENISELVIIIFDTEIKRYSSINNLKKAIYDILKDIEIDYRIILTRENFDTIYDWENFVIENVGHDDIIMYNSKENYENKKLDNKYIKCINSNEVSVSNIEKEIFKPELYNVICKEFRKYINKKILITSFDNELCENIFKILYKLFNTNGVNYNSDLQIDKYISDSNKILFIKIDPSDIQKDLIIKSEVDNEYLLYNNQIIDKVFLLKSKNIFNNECINFENEYNSLIEFIEENEYNKIISDIENNILNLLLIKRS